MCEPEVVADLVCERRRLHKLRPDEIIAPEPERNQAITAGQIAYSGFAVGNEVLVIRRAAAIRIRACCW